MKKYKIYWVGIVNRTIYFFPNEYNVKSGEIFKTKKEAMKCYSKVIKIKISPINELEYF